ncbi:MAG: AbrB/MazE/SpoVT family DNA-binding domain-containing protein [Candidatus Altiarchaeales archaeon HGW-Altiarchaeales-2]|nr:MAG: AbrB/MazE/SpoVT family DNA-binding domain-containing protein [Candidatus Altiarchaeales archaeon HGW-Altiarchaeales-2]
MKAVVVPIGNSRGIRIPKTILEQCHIEQEVTLNVKDDSVIIKPIKKETSKNRSASFKKNPVEDMDGLIKLNPKKAKEAEEIINTDIELLL